MKGNVRFSLIQETPSMLTKYVELYYNELSLFTSANQAFPSATSGAVTHSLANSVINQVNYHSLTYTAPQAFFAVVY